jgi:hypothetical protein
VARRAAALERRRHPLRALARGERLQRRSELGPIGETELGIELEQGEQDETPRGDLGVREGEAVGFQLEVAQQQEVDVDRAGTMARSTGSAALLGLDRLAQVKQVLGLEGSPDPDRGVEEIRLVDDLADRLRLVQRGDGLDLDVAAAQVLDRLAQLGFAVADVRAESEVAGPQTPSSSSDSRSSERSRVTSTAASWTG